MQGILRGGEECKLCITERSRKKLKIVQAFEKFNSHIDQTVQLIGSSKKTTKNVQVISLRP